ncbi:hypothetical protein Sjap_007866 [Stephania japonica]|uniref:J domain-containing protein n=1 Tax=Stephania japonica TaxID=461633 RepID=A0AAP0PAT8_9MAGN
METLFSFSTPSLTTPQFSRFRSPSNLKAPIFSSSSSSSSSSSICDLFCRCNGSTSGDHQSATDEDLSISSAYDALGVDRDCSIADLKSAFRSKVKQFHPDVRKSGSDSMIRRVISAYELLLERIGFGAYEREQLDPFDEPECEAFDVFVNETLCVGKVCPYSCVKTAPHAFSFVTSTGTARTTSQGHGDDYEVQLAVGQCPRSCIHFVTPSQRVILEELLDSIMSFPFDNSADADYLYSLITKAKFENNRYRKPKRQPKASTDNVDWF